ncbi:hypothetical protein [Polyangium jinanense]|uniref:Lipoprotein n=1 Tax=Polyangium jinanense TaxID=2829994 RepID=A0A9X3X0H2_9BACT|nr:hypothetical protein [Polyangium jinanense]MDC3955503.1 hypothetical protein [Polyangium jinanense]MDC3981804.1 hypothetical protein [Polyangium jinanense]
MKTRVTLVSLLLVSFWGCSGGDGTTGVPIATDPGPQPLRGDTLPEGAVSFFKKLACPEGWKPYEPATGRTIVAASEEFPSGATVGEPLASQEERTHSHAIAATVEIPAVSYVGAPGGGNAGVGQAGAVSFATTSELASDDIPYVQLLVCRKNEPSVKRATPLPSRLLMFFDLPECPAGWKPAEGTTGRLLVGLPQDAPADRPFGGDPFTSPALRSHGHAVSSTLETPSHGIALAGGCCGDGYAKNGTYEFAVETEPSEVDMPMLALLQCEKE